MTKKVFTPCSLNRLLYLCFLGLCVFAFLGITASVADDNQTAFTPDVVGMTVGDAVGAFKDAGFTNSPDIVTDALVTGQNPPAGTEVSIQEIYAITTDSDTVSGKSPTESLSGILTLCYHSL